MVILYFWKNVHFYLKCHIHSFKHREVMVLVLVLKSMAWIFSVFCIRISHTSLLLIYKYTFCIYFQYSNLYAPLHQRNTSDSYLMLFQFHSTRLQHLNLYLRSHQKSTHDSLCYFNSILSLCPVNTHLCTVEIERE